KVTLFCRRMPLWDVMQGLSRALGHAWVWSKRKGAYRYELMRDPRHGVFEELRRDLHGADVPLRGPRHRCRSRMFLHSLGVHRDPHRVDSGDLSRAPRASARARAEAQAE